MQDGGFSSLGAIIKQKIYHFDTVADMKNCLTLIPGDVVQTNGYYMANDGGQGVYEIVNDSSLEDDGGFIHNIINGLKGKLIIRNNKVNFKTLGAKAQSINGDKYDNKLYLQRFLNYVQNTDIKLTLFIPSGIYYFSPTIIETNNGCDIKGIASFPHGESVKGTILTTLTANQDYLFQFGNTSIQQNLSLKNLVFSTADYNYDIENKKWRRVKPYKGVKDVCVRICNTQYSITDNLFFMNINGSALAIRNSWEIYFGLLNFRSIAGFSDTKGILLFEKRLENENGNITACTFEKLMFEGFSKHLITVESGAAFGHCDFNTINVEDYSFTFFENEISTPLVNNNSLPENYKSIALFDLGNAEGLVVNNILLNNISTRKIEYNGITYVFDTVVKVRNGMWANLIINNISTCGMSKNSYLVLQPNDVIVNHYSVLNFNNIERFANDNGYKYIINVKGFPYIHADYVNLDVSKGEQSLEINSNFDAFYKVFNLATSVPRGFLYYDKNSINRLKLVVKPLTMSELTDTSDAVFAKFYTPCSSMKIRAKIEKDKTAKLAYRKVGTTSSSDLKFANLVGTGNFKWYTIFNENKDEHIQIASSFLETEISIDCVRFE